MTSKPTVLVLIPCFNGADYLAASINSVLSQSYSPKRILVIDDGSTDRSGEIAESFMLRSPLVHVHRNSNNRGKACVLNEQFDQAIEDYIFLQDADDISHPERIMKQVEFMELNPDVGCSSSFIRYINSNGKIVGKGSLDLTSVEFLNRCLQSGDPFGLFCPATVIRTAVFKNRNLRFRHQFWPADDIDLWNRIAEAGWQVLAQPEYLVDYRIHSTSAVTSSFQRTRDKYEFVRACLRARRQGQIEPDWEEFENSQKSRPFLAKINAWRKSAAKGLYRSAGFQIGDGKTFRGLFSLFEAAILQPKYVFRRLAKQMQ